MSLSMHEWVSLDNSARMQRTLERRWLGLSIPGREHEATTALRTKTFGVVRWFNSSLV